jgi:hypothetical protein
MPYEGSGSRPPALGSGMTDAVTNIERLDRTPAYIRPGKQPSAPALLVVEPVPRIALTQQEACASLCCNAVYFLEQVRLQLRVARSDGKRASATQSSITGSPTSPGKPCPHAVGTRAIGRCSQRTSPVLMLALSFGDRGGFRGA